MSTLYSTAWLIHFAGILTWLGPTTAAWVLVRGAVRSGDDRILLWVRHAARSLYRLEHIGLTLLLIGGVGLLYAKDWLPMSEPWFHIKLTVFVLVVVPMELVHFRNLAKVNRALRAAGDAMTDDLRQKIGAEDRFIARVFWLSTAAIAAIILLAVFKPAFGA